MQMSLIKIYKVLAGSWKDQSINCHASCVSLRLKSRRKWPSGPRTSHLNLGRDYILISFQRKKKLGMLQIWALIVDDFSDYMQGRFFNKKSELGDNIMPILKKLNAQGKEVKYIRFKNNGENKTLEQNCIESGLDITFEYTAPYSP